VCLAHKSCQVKEMKNWQPLTPDQRSCFLPFTERFIKHLTTYIDSKSRTAKDICVRIKNDSGAKILGKYGFWLGLDRWIDEIFVSPDLGYRSQISETDVISFPRVH
jgi:hypothetical protein